MAAYSITDVEVLDADEFKRYRELAAAARVTIRRPLLGPWGRARCCRGGEWPSGQRVNVIEFASMEQLRAWYNSPEYAPARDIARNALRRRLLFVEGVDPK
jgi:uncharacterized protein (DUF1330 family)